MIQAISACPTTIADILEAAEGFWNKMETEGLVSLQ